MKNKSFSHPQLVQSLRQAYSVEKAACFAYSGHAASLRDPAEKAAIRQIELDEWEHRAEVLKIKDAKWPPLFERVFNWGVDHSLNDVDQGHPFSEEKIHSYYRDYRTREAERETHLAAMK
ncbi:MAG: rubrerythrin [Lentimonas sp.]|jgi:rubrerythrin